MKNYRVGVVLHEYASIIVQAEDEEKAMAIAKKATNEQKYDFDALISSADDWDVSFDLIDELSDEEVEYASYDELVITLDDVKDE